MKFRISEFDEVRIIHLSGDFYLYAVPAIDESWDEVIQAGPSVIAFDCKELTFIDSAAIGILVKFVKSADEKNIDVEFINVKSGVMKIFTACRLDTVFKITTKKDFCARNNLSC